MAFGSNRQKFVPESALIELLPAFSDYTYDRHEPRYPYEIPGFYSHMKLAKLNVEEVNWDAAGG